MKMLKINYKSAFDVIFKIALIVVLYQIAVGMRYEYVGGRNGVFDKWNRVVWYWIPALPIKESILPRLPLNIERRSFKWEQRMVYSLEGKTYYIPKSKEEKFKLLRPGAKKIGQEEIK